MARNKPVVELKVEVEENKVFAVSEESYPFMESDGYNTKVIRKMEWDKDKLIEEIKNIEEEQILKTKEIEEDNIKIKNMDKELNEVKKLRQWKQVKENWAIYSKVYGGIAKEQEKIKVENLRDRKQLTVDHEKKLLKNYKEVLSTIEKNEKDN